MWKYMHKHTHKHLSDQVHKKTFTSLEKKTAPPAFIPRNGFPGADWIIQSTNTE